MSLDAEAVPLPVPSSSEVVMADELASRSEVDRWRAIIRATESAPTPLTEEQAAIVALHMGAALDAAIRIRSESQPVADAPRPIARPRAKAS